MKIALVGCGAAAEAVHIPAIARIFSPGDVVLVDPDRQRALELARLLGGGEVVGSHGRVRTEAAIVAVPNDLHANVVTDLLSAGVHVLCEKPLGRTAAEASAIAAAAPLGIVLGVAHFRRFFPSLELLKELLDRRFYGRPVRFEAEEGFVYAWAHSGFMLDRERAGGGVLIDLGTHVLDELRHLFGPLELERYQDDSHGGVEADCRLQLSAGGVPGTLELSRTRTLGSRLLVECEDGLVSGSLARGAPILVADRHGTSHTLEVDKEVAGEDGGYLAAFERQLRLFLDAARSGSPPPVPASDAIAVAEFVDACYSTRAQLSQPWVFETLIGVSAV